jgi:hypothetical protein
MLKNILKINGTKELSKAEQHKVSGGNSCNTYVGPFCYGPVKGCASCSQWQALPTAYQRCFLVHTVCVGDSDTN